MGLLSNLKPAGVWNYFEDICRIPRLSGNEERIRQYLLSFAGKHHLVSKEDSTGNIIITREASKGFGNRKTVVLQSHMDMVGEKNADHPHNWSKDPIIPVLHDEWVSASGTTLGADDGIGIAAQMAILTSKELKSGRIECLFTVDEESGMTGAINLEPGFFTGKTLINLDSEDEGILFIGCAGGMDTVGTINYQPVAVKDDSRACIISVTGLRGGHSGDEIHKGYGNSIKIMNRLLRELSDHFNISLADFNGGNLRNAIPREAFATIVTGPDDYHSIEEWINNYSSLVKKEYRTVEKELMISVAPGAKPDSVIDKNLQADLVEALDRCPHGVVKWSTEMDDLVETSTNLASIRFNNEDNTITVITTQRSSVEQAKHDIASTVKSALVITGAKVIHSHGYPGWQPDLSSEILKITRKSYSRLFGREPLVRAIHAGLECGLIHEKVKGIDMISFGPTIRGAHTPEEKIEIETVQMFWDLLVDVINNIPDTSGND